MCLAVPGLVESIRDEIGTRMGRVNFGGGVKDVCLAYLHEIAVGDSTIVPVGFAIRRRRVRHRRRYESVRYHRRLKRQPLDFKSEQQPNLQDRRVALRRKLINQQLSQYSRRAWP